MCDRSGRTSHRKIAGFVVRRWDRAQRVADPSRCSQLSAARKDRSRPPGETKCEALSFFALRHKHSQTFAGAAGLKEFSHRKLVAFVSALGQDIYEVGRAFRQDDVTAKRHGIA